ncbi:hypothetical protein [Oryzicola mucosus]|uniref:Uncharacterized protein n=1 Tax=Oryzicola mucosus TaxID=2767425 RepID=A0A8J6PS25_9HYPH|nr:hypothetical protein [Oryzicola mucosus]MBD0413999.1 hypothetical protein [Oryzicola mucosus]
MRQFFAALLLFALSGSAEAEEIVSAYTEFDIDRDCAVTERATEGEGTFSNYVCNGYRGFPVILSVDDMRESIVYGFPGADKTAWESFSGFNSAGPRIEWRLATYEGMELPFATIRRWFVHDPDEDDKKLEILVVSKIGQPGEADGCVVGLVMATGKPDANDMARIIADRQARDFACGADERVFVGEPIPEFSRQD